VLDYSFSVIYDVSGTINLGIVGKYSVPGFRPTRLKGNRRKILGLVSAFATMTGKVCRERQMILHETEVGNPVVSAGYSGVQALITGTREIRTSRGDSGFVAPDSRTDLSDSPERGRIVDENLKGGLVSDYCLFFLASR